MLTFLQKRDLIKALEKCAAVKDKETRTLIVNELPLDWTVNLKRSDALRIDLSHIVNAVAGYREGIAVLVECTRFYERDTIPMQAVDQLLQEMETAVSAAAVYTPVAEPEAVDPDTQLAQKLHWDRDIYVRTFVGMVKGNPQYAPWRLLALQGPPEAGLETLVKRLEYICEELAKRDGVQPLLLHGRINLQKLSSPTPQRLVKEILNTLARNADLRLAAIRKQETPEADPRLAIYRQASQELDRMIDCVDENWNERIDSRKQQSNTELARELTDCLNEAGRQGGIVLLFENFELLDSASRIWFLDDWLGRHLVNLEQTTIVVVGQWGLGVLEGRDAFTYFRANIPTMSQAQFLEWARQGWGLSWVNEELIKEADGDCKGNPVKFLTWLKAWASLSKIKPPEEISWRPVGRS